ncbi:sensor histidine kinase [Fulvivirga lutea]|nr:histidine kinase [Fulvivirga lutea]
MNKLKLYWSLQIGGWLMFAIVQILGFLLLGDVRLSIYQIAFWFLEAGLFLVTTHLFRSFIIKRKWLSYNMSKLIPRVILAVIILASVVYILRMAIAMPLNMYNPNVAWRMTNFLGLSSVYALIFFLWSVLYFIYHYFERYNTSLKHEAAMNEIELNNLKSQLNPHFIFNALNSIRALVDENPKKSKNSITQLSNILRNSLVTDKKKLTSFNEELKIVKDYLGLETIRFEERLKTSFEIHPDSNMFQVPPLMLQTLVENGVKHGISKLKEGGFVKLKTSVTDNEFIIQIRNSGTYKLNGVSKNKPGLGLKNTRHRLELLYGDKARVEIRNESKNIVLTELIIPNNESINN